MRQERFVMPHSHGHLADCLERVADDHSGCFTEEDALVIEWAISALREVRGVVIPCAHGVSGRRCDDCYAILAAKRRAA